MRRPTRRWWRYSCVRVICKILLRRAQTFAWRGDVSLRGPMGFTKAWRGDEAVDREYAVL